MKVIGAIVAAVLVIVLILAVVVGGSYVSAKNQMVALNESVKSNWSEVDVNLQRRADLIPNLVETVKGYAAHEQTVFDDIAKARSSLLGAQTPQDKIAAKINSMARSAVCCSSSKIIRSCKPTRIFCACRTNSPGRKIGSPSRASVITIRCRLTTRISGSSRIAYSRAGLASSATTRTSKPPKPRAQFRRFHFRRPIPLPPLRQNRIGASG